MSLKIFVEMPPNLVFHTYIVSDLLNWVHNPKYKKRFQGVISLSETKLLAQSSQTIWKIFPKIVSCKNIQEFIALIPNREIREIFDNIYEDFYRQHWLDVRKELQNFANKLGRVWKRKKIEKLLTFLFEGKIPTFKIYLIESLGFSGCLCNNKIIFLGSEEILNSLVTLIHEICHYMLERKLVITEMFRENEKTQILEYLVFFLQFKICKRLNLRINEQEILKFHKAETF